MDAKATRPKVTWMAVALIAATTTTSGGCAKLYHTIRYNCVSRMVGESHRTYYHGSNTGKIVPKDKRLCNVYEPPCYGYQATCWHRWPEGCGVCENQEQVIYDGPYTTDPMGQPTHANEPQAAEEVTPVDETGGAQRLPETGEPAVDEALDTFDAPPARTPASPSDVDGAQNDAPSQELPPQDPNAVPSEMPVQPESTEAEDAAVDEPIVEEPSETLPTYVDEIPAPADLDIPLREGRLPNTRRTVAAPKPQSPVRESRELGLPTEPVTDSTTSDLGSEVARRADADFEPIDFEPLDSSVRTQPKVDLPHRNVETPVARVSTTQASSASMDRTESRLTSIDAENQRKFAERHALDLPAPIRPTGPMPTPLAEDTATRSNAIPSFSLPVSKAKAVAAVEQLELEQDEEESSELRFSNGAPTRPPQRLGSTSTELRFR